MHDDNPYRTPQTDCGRGSFRERWRRAVLAYHESIRRENISGWAHAKAWLTLPLLLLITMFIVWMNMIVLR